MSDDVSPYVRAAAERAGITGSHADHRDSDYHFPRCREDRRYVELERSPPVFTHWDVVKAIAVMLAAFGLVPFAEFVYWTFK